MRLFRREPTPPPAVCGCGHHLALHDRDNRRCHHLTHILEQREEVVRRPDGSPVYRNRGGTVQTVVHRIQVPVECRCRQYIGPEPVLEFVTPTYLPPQIPE